MADKNLEAVLCDLDDTLIPTSKISDAAIAAAIDTIMLKGLDMPREHIYSTYMQIRKELGSRYKQHFNVVFERLGVPKIKAHELISAARMNYHLATMALMPFHDVYGTLHDLNEMKYARYIVTDGNSLDQWDKINKCKFDDQKFFQGVFITEDYQFQTKCPEFYKMILEKTGLEGKRCLVVGDKIDSDIRPARECGIHTARVLTGRFNEEKYEDDADYVIPRFSDVLKVILEIEKAYNK